MPTGERSGEIPSAPRPNFSRRDQRITGGTVLPGLAGGSRIKESNNSAGKPCLLLERSGIGTFAKVLSRLARENVTEPVA